MAIPSSAARADGQMDPGDWCAIRINCAELLDVNAGEEIDPANCSLAVSAEGVALGVLLGSAGDRAPAIVGNGTAILIWLSVNEAQQNAPAYDAGVDVALTVKFRTTATPWQRFERTWVVRFVNR